MNMSLGGNEKSFVRFMTTNFSGLILIFLNLSLTIISLLPEVLLLNIKDDIEDRKLIYKILLDACICHAYVMYNVNIK